MEMKFCLSWKNLCLLFLFNSHSASHFLCTENTNIYPYETSPGVIRLSKSESRYLNNQFCELTILTDIQGHGIQLNVTKVHLKGKDINGQCNKNFVEIFDNSGEKAVLMDRFCALDKDMTYLSVSRNLTIRFHSDSTLTFFNFQATYQAVPVGIESREEVKKSRIFVELALSIGLISMLLVFAIAIVKIKNCILKRSTPRPTLATTPTQNTDFPSLSLPRSPSPFVSYSVYGDGSSGASRNLPLQVNMPEGADEGSLHAQSDTLPPAYDSLDLGSDSVDQREMSLAPPSYEMVVKQNMGPSN